VRTTFTLDDDALATANAYARARALDLGQAISELIRRGSAEKLPLKHVDGVWVVDLRADAAPLSTRRIRRMDNESA